MPNNDINKLIEILSANSDKSFVDRIINPKGQPTLKNPDGSISTHSMAWGETEDGKVFVYPTVLRTKDGSLKRFSDDDAWRNTQQTGNFIEMPSREEADWFTKNYKRIWR